MTTVTIWTSYFMITFHLYHYDINLSQNN